MNSPEIYLAVNNCFASKRWTNPSEWMDIVRSLGLNYIEASADNECDPLYTNAEYLSDWLQEIEACTQKTGIKVANFYSGHGTYSTLGLGHTDIRIRDRMLNDWLKPMIRMASRLNAGLGFYCHAFPDSVLQNNTEYSEAEKDLYARLVNLADYAEANHLSNLSIEQMYSPHQIPWTIKGAKKLMREVYGKSRFPLYITIDTGHQTGQRKFIAPSSDRIGNLISMAREKREITGIWLGSKTAYDIFDLAVTDHETQLEVFVKSIENEMSQYSYLFAEKDDDDLYCWLNQLACYSPIIHLQQTDGKSSSHEPFTKENNLEGIVSAEKVLKAIKSSFAGESDQEMPPKVERIYLTLELFSATADFNHDIRRRMRDSIIYWRNFVPHDGMTLDELTRH